MPSRDIVVIGASAGGVPALSELVSQLPENLAAAVCVVLHLAPHVKSELPDILQRRTRLRVLHPTHSTRIQAGHIYVAPPDRHLLLEDGHILTTYGPKENRARPSVDALFRSAAYEYGARVVGVVLTGALYDGSAGLWSVKRRGGMAVIQDPRDALYPSMPESALRYVKADHVVPLSKMGKLIAELVAQEPATEEAARDARLDIEVAIAKGKNAREAGAMQLGAQSAFTCPECHGTLMRIDEEKLTRFRCHTGHAYTLECLLGDLSRSVEDNLWSAVRVMDEQLFALRELAGKYEQVAERSLAKGLHERATSLAEKIELVRSALAPDRAAAES